MYSYKLNNSYTVYVNYSYLNECIKASKKYSSNSKTKKSSTFYTKPIVIRDTVKVGSEVSVLNIDTQKRDIFKLDYSENINISKRIISDTSPVGRALLGHSVGDTITVQVPAGTVRYKIMDLRS